MHSPGSDVLARATAHPAGQPACSAAAPSGKSLVAFIRSRCVDASDAMLCWEISVLCSSATSEAAANVELHSPTCSAAASFRAVVRYTASVLHFSHLHAAAVDRHHSLALSRGHAHASGQVVQPDASHVNDAFANACLEVVHTPCHEDPPWESFVGPVRFALRQVRERCFQRSCVN